MLLIKSIRSPMSLRDLAADVTILYNCGEQQTLCLSQFGGVPYTIPPSRNAVAPAVYHMDAGDNDWVQVNGRYTTTRDSGIQVRFYTSGLLTWGLFNSTSPECFDSLIDMPNATDITHHHQCECKAVWLCKFRHCQAKPHRNCVDCVFKSMQRPQGRPIRWSTVALNAPVQAAQSDLDASVVQHFRTGFDPAYSSEYTVNLAIDEAGDWSIRDTETGHTRSNSANTPDQGTSELRNPAGERENTPYSSERVHTIGLGGFYRRG